MWGGGGGGGKAEVGEEGDYDNLEGKKMVLHFMLPPSIPEYSCIAVVI